ncbi:ABC transporter related [Alkaliphilus metalliredigens QYMF]|uniref:ABC transporter related n=1 Tax=Alkaliphilus metalliredigens (strain QYMF) TaxID=293826 RepID=A6TME9_ALKMQ|nr:ABC transporter ATP-binding protein [Alkaliphilus metalliredigens]ABR47367.1 ABC transporter related [Alkaliphilus metalliredigens QYMF]
MNNFEKPMIKIDHLTKQYGNGCEFCRDFKNTSLQKNYCPKCETVYACQDISLEVFEGEILGVVGESGSGKSTLLSCLYFDQEVSRGEAYINHYENGNINILALSSQKKRFVRNHVLGMVYQNPTKGLKMKVSSIGNIAEKLIAAGNRRVDTMEKRGYELLEHVNIPLVRIKEFPENFSGGMQQRVQIAKALSNNPPILLLDEVTTGLDLSVQANVLDLIKKIQRELKITMIVVSHDLAVIRMLADRSIVMLNGKIIESGITDQILEDPQHQYTQELVHSLL